MYLSVNGRLLKQLLQHKGLPRWKVCESRIDKATLSKWINGKQRAYVENLQAVAKFLEVDWRDLVDKEKRRLLTI